MSAEMPFIYVCGSDDFLVGRTGKARFEELAKEVTDEFSREVISGYVNNVGELEEAMKRFREAVQTVSMFGGRRLVWLKDVNFLTDSVVGRAKGTEAVLEELQEILGASNPAEVLVLVTAAPVDRRRSFAKWCEKNGDCTVVGGGAGGRDEKRDAMGEMLADLAVAEAEQQGVKMEEGAELVLVQKIGGNTRLMVEEVAKLATYVGAGGTITQKVVAELTPDVSEGDFFETAEAFFSGDLRRTLEALRDHFYAGGDARPVIASLQNRNRLLVQLRVLLDEGGVRLGGFGLEKSGWERAKGKYGELFGEGEKSAFNVFSQHPFYLGKLAGGLGRVKLPRLIENQQEFLRAFEEIHRRPDEQEAVLREMCVRCLAEK